MAMTSRPDRDTSTCHRTAKTYWHSVKKTHMKYMCVTKTGPLGTEAVVHSASEKADIILNRDQGRLSEGVQEKEPWEEFIFRPR